MQESCLLISKGKFPLLLRSALVGLLFIAVVQAASGQSRKANSNNGQAVLHISATVVSVVSAPTAYSGIAVGSPVGINYNLQANAKRLTVIDEIRPLTAAYGFVGGKGMLKTTTVVTE